MPIKTAGALNTNQLEYYCYDQLYTLLRTKYNEKEGVGLVCFEVYDTNEDRYVKPHFDIEKDFTEAEVSELSKQNKTAADACNDIKEECLRILNRAFLIDGDNELLWAISCANRVQNINKGDQLYVYKASYHFVLNIGKCETSRLKTFMQRVLSKYKDNASAQCIDLSVYRKGINKFRVPFANKKAGANHCVLVPLNYDSRADYGKHLLTHGLDELPYWDPITGAFADDAPNDESGDNDNENDNNKYRQRTERTNRTNPDNKATVCNDAHMQSLIDQYTIISTKYGVGIIYYDITEFECGKTHNNNHNYLTCAVDYGKLTVKCHSKRCQEFSKVLYDSKLDKFNFIDDEEIINSITRDLYVYDPRVFKTLPILEGKLDNYDECKELFEKFFVLLRDENNYYRRIFKLNLVGKHYVDSFKCINIGGYSDVQYCVKKRNKKGVIVEVYENFIKRYKSDENKRYYTSFVFEPLPYNVVTTDDSNYNLFRGFGYKQGLFENENNIVISDDDRAQLRVLLDYIKSAICDNNEALYHYLLQYLKSIIARPTFVPHIILVFFSYEHGTGKSSLLKFIKKVIGDNLCDDASLKQIVEKHSNHHANKLLNIVEEVNRTNSFQFNDIIKDYSQRVKAPLNEKNKQIREIDVYCRYMFTTNKEDGIYIEPHDRRYVVIKSAKIYDNNALIDEIGDIYENPVMPYIFGKYLEEEVELTFRTQRDWYINRPLIKDYYLMKASNPVDDFLISVLRGEITLPNTQIIQDHVIQIKKMILYAAYKGHHLSTGVGFPKGTISFYKYVNSRFAASCTECRKSNVRYYRIDLVALWDKLIPEEPFCT